jgi:hypothetical protein
MYLSLDQERGRERETEAQHPSSISWATSPSEKSVAKDALLKKGPSWDEEGAKRPEEDSGVPKSMDQNRHQEITRLRIDNCPSKAQHCRGVDQEVGDQNTM